MRRCLEIRTLWLLGFVFCATSAGADNAVLAGGRLGYYSSAGAPSVGGELLFRIAPSIDFNPNVEFVFKDDRHLTFNLDFHYDLPARRRAYVWLGAGLAIVSINPPGPAAGRTDAGLNLLFGVGRRRGPVIPYFQAKVIANDQTELALAVGLRF